MSTTQRARLSRRDLLRLGGTAVAAGLAAPVATSCNRTADEGSGGDGSFTMYWNAGHVYQAYEDVVRQFEDDHGVTVNWQNFQWPDLQTKLQADISAGTVPDLVEQPGGYYAIGMALSDDVLALDPYIEADGKAIGFPDDWQTGSVTPWQNGGRTYGVQLHLTCNQLYYNTTMLDDAGVEPPTTWDELLRVGETLTTDDRSAMALNQDYTYSPPWMLQNGVRYYDPDAGEFLVPHDAALEALRFQYELIHEHGYSPAPTPSSDYSGPQKLLSAQRAAMILTGPWDILPIDEAGGVDLGIAPPLKGRVRKTHLAGSGVIIPAKSKNADLAWDLIKRMTTLDVELAVTKESDLTMPRKSWAQASQVKSDPELGAVAAALPYGVDWWEDIAQTGKVPEVDDAYNDMYQSIAIQGADPESAMNTFLDRAHEIVG
jgi:multiple sugar transport system substrate-binding protein